MQEKKVVKTGRNGGRKPFVLSDTQAKEFEDLCKCGCFVTEIAAQFNVDVKTLKKAVCAYHEIAIKDFSAFFNQKRELQKVLLKKARMKRALNGSDVMLTYLSKQVLEENDRQSLDVNFDIDYSSTPRPDFTKE